MTYPKILILREDQPHKEKWERYFRAMYLDELKRLEVMHSSPEVEMKNEVVQFTLT